MNIEVGLSFFWVAVGLALLGYFIGNGLKKFQSKSDAQEYHAYYQLIEENQLYLYVNISEKDMEDLLRKKDGAPKIVLNGKTYYHLVKFQEWLNSDELYRDA
ncbi:DNA-binding protein [Shouchella sp. 1P09AA]|uniref:DNA-binding protein n=1 Tax=unclassified Shouchella TaxID=2893065 RepID=UPI00399F379B